MNFNHALRRGDDYTTTATATATATAAAPWWKKRTLMEKRLVIATTVTCFVIASLLVALLVTYSGRPDACTSSSCVRSANEILLFVDPTQDPCDDFYQFACGNFLKDGRLDDNKSTVMKDVMDNLLVSQIKQMIEGPAREDDPPSFAKTKTFYRACMNESGIDSQGLKIMADVLKDVGGWPTLDGNWKGNDFDWKHVTRKLRKNGYSFELFIRVEVAVDKIYQTKHIIEIKPPDSRRLEIKERYRDLYRGYVTDVAVLMGATKIRADRDTRDVLEFQEALRKVVKKSEERRRGDESYAPRTLSNLHGEILAVPWFGYINDLLFPSAKITADENLYVPDIVYIKEMLGLFSKADRRTLANFMVSHFVLDFIDFLPRQFRERKKLYLTSINEPKGKARWEICLHHAESITPTSLQDLYVERYISKTVKDNVREMVDNIRRRFDKRIDKLDWLDEQGVEIAKEKIASVRDYVADYGEGYEDKAIEDIYGQVEIHEDKFLLSLLHLIRIKKNVEYRRLHEQVMHDGEASNAMYSISENILKIPVDYLHDIYYDIDRPQYMNYGAIGSIIGRELSNMFLEGKQHDVRGNLKEFSMSQSLMNYDSKTGCFQKQYERFYIPEIHKSVNKSLSNIQDIAELAGKKISYEAYGVWSSNNIPEPSLPGVDYPLKQLFWISSALYHCAKHAARDAEQILADGKQTLSNFKVNGPLRNLKEFADDFYCDIGTKMNPADKCEMWEV